MLLRHSTGLPALLSIALVFSGCAGNPQNNLSPQLTTQTAPTTAASPVARRTASRLTRPYAAPADLPTSFTIYCPKRSVTGPYIAPYCAYYDPGTSSNQYVVAGDANCGVFDLESLQTHVARIGVFKVVGYSHGSCTVALTDSNNATATGTIRFFGRKILGPLTLTCVTNASSNTATCKYADPLYTGQFSVETDSTTCSATRPAGGSLTVTYSVSQACTVTLTAVNTEQQARFHTTFTTHPLFVTNASAYPEGNVTEYVFPYTGAPIVTNTNGIHDPFDLAFDSGGHLFVANVRNNTITEYAPPYTGAPIATIPVPAPPYGIAIDSSNYLFVSLDPFTEIRPRVSEYAPPYTGAPITTITIGIDAPIHLAFDPAGDLFVANEFGNTVTQYVYPFAVIPSHTIATEPAPRGVVLDGSDDLFVTSEYDNTVTEYAPPYTGSPKVTISTNVLDPASLAIDNAGDLFVGNLQNNTVTEYTPPYTGAPIVTISGVLGPTGLTFGP
jgi:hypothetical protein